MTVTYNVAPNMATDLSTANPGSLCLTGSNRPTISSAVPTLRGSAGDFESDPTKLKFEVWTLDGSSRVASGTSASVPAESVVGWQVPSGAMASGTSYKWRALSNDGTDDSPYWSEWCEFAVDTTSAAAYVQAEYFLKGVDEHLAAAGPGPSESSLKTTPAGATAFASLSSTYDAERTENVSYGVNNVVTTELYSAGASSTWRRVPYFNRFAKTRSWWLPNIYNVRVGDVITVDYTGDKEPDHAVVVTSFTASRVPAVSYHSSWNTDYSLDKFKTAIQADAIRWANKHNKPVPALTWFAFRMSR